MKALLLGIALMGCQQYTDPMLDALPRPSARVPINVENQTFEEVVVYLSIGSGGTPMRIGRAGAVATTPLKTMRSNSSPVYFVAKFLDGKVLVSEPVLQLGEASSITVIVLSGRTALFVVPRR